MISLLVMSAIVLDVVVAVDDDERRFFAWAISLMIPFQPAMANSSIVRSVVAVLNSMLMVFEIGASYKSSKIPHKLSYLQTDYSLTA